MKSSLRIKGKRLILGIHIGIMISLGINTSRSFAALNTSRNFSDLINHYAEGRPALSPWAGYWWPYTQDGIAASGNASLSPAAKYDLALGEHQAETWEKRFHGKTVPRVQSWWGHGNGWAAASVLFPEPRNPITVNGVEFSVADIKALLTEVGMSVNADFWGERVDVDDPSSPKYHDTIPDQYFLLLTNYIGKLKKGLIMDRYTGSQVWNHPIAGYRFNYPQVSDYLGNTPEAPNIYRIVVTSTVWWADDAVAPDTLTDPFSFINGNHYGSRALKMELWLDAPVVFNENGKIISSGNVIVQRVGESLVGGAWRMGDGYLVDAWPDYVWMPHEPVKPTDPDQDYVNPYIDLEWVKKNLLNTKSPASPAVDPSEEFHRLPTKLPSDKVVYAQGWSSLKAVANLAKTTVTSTGHFLTSRNACGKEAYGVLSIEDWNRLAQDLNTVAHSIQASVHCVPAPEFWILKGIDAELSLLGTQLKLYELQGDEICSSISDVSLSSRLLDVLQKVIEVADKEDCPNGWGS